MSKRLLWLFCFGLIPSSALAGLLRVESTTAYAQYRDDDLALQRPFFEFFKGSFNSAGLNDLQLDTNFSISENPTTTEQSFDLYALDGSAWLVPEKTRLTVGRAFFTHMTVRPRVLDSLSLEHFMFDKAIRFGAYVGIERPPEALTQERSKITGVSLGYVSPNVSPLTTTLRYEHQVLSVAERNRLKFSANQPLQFSASPELMLDAERDLDFNIWSRSEVGVDFYPSIKSTFGARYQIYELDPLTQPDQPIFNILSQGRTQEVGFKAGYFLSPELFGSYYYAQNNYLVQTDFSNTGERHQLALDAAIKWWKFNASLYRITSYGGWVQGVRAGAGAKMNSRVDVSAQSEYSLYEKVTSSKRAAYSNQLGISYFLSNMIHIDMIGEWNNNNSSSEDTRFFLKLTYLTWKET